MPEKKKNEMTDSDRFKSLYFDSSQENLLLKGGRTHRLSIGGVTLEIVPSSKMSPKQVFNMYIKFLKELKELHGDKHLLAPKDEQPNTDGLAGLFGQMRGARDGVTLGKCQWCNRKIEEGNLEFYAQLAKVINMKWYCGDCIASMKPMVDEVAEVYKDIEDISNKAGSPVRLDPQTGRLVRTQALYSSKAGPNGGKEMPQNNNKLEEMVGLFRNESKKGEIYYSGKTKDGKEVVMFRNSYWEEGSNKPYFRLYDKGNQQQAQD